MTGVKVLFDTSTEEGKFIASIPRGSRKLFLEILINSFISQCKSRNVAPDVAAFRLIQKHSPLEQEAKEEIKQEKQKARETLSEKGAAVARSEDSLLCTTYDEALGKVRKIIAEGK